MKIAYDAEVDILSIVFMHKQVKESAEVLPGVIVDFDFDNQITAFEIMDASKFTDLTEVNVALPRIVPLPENREQADPVTSA